MQRSWKSIFLLKTAILEKLKKSFTHENRFRKKRFSWKTFFIIVSPRLYIYLSYISLYMKSFLQNFSCDSKYLRILYLKRRLFCKSIIVIRKLRHYIYSIIYIKEGSVSKRKKHSLGIDHLLGVDHSLGIDHLPVIYYLLVITQAKSIEGARPCA